MPTILSINSFRKPFMTAITIISVATPSMMPRKKPAMTEMKPSLRRALQVSAGQQPFECRERQGARDILHGVTLARFR